MIARMNKKGFTLLELLAVFAIIFIILTFTVPKVLATINNSKTEADIANLDSLNRATEQYGFFLDIDNQSIPDNLTQQILLEEGFINDILEPLNKEKDFVWDGLSQSWKYLIKESGDDTNSSEGFILNEEEDDSYEFNEDWMLEPTEDSDLVITGGWESLDKGETISIVMDEDEDGPFEGAFLVKHDIFSSYSVIVDSELDRSGQLKFIEYGIYFEAGLDETTEEPVSGYLFQVDYVKDKGTYHPRYILKELKDNGDENDIYYNDENNSLYYNTITQVDIVDNNKIQISVKNKDDNNATILGPLIFKDNPPYQINPINKYSGVTIYSSSSNSNMLFFDIQVIPYE